MTRVPPPFNRRDSACYASGAALLAVLAAGAASRSAGWGPPGTGLAVVAAACGAVLLVAALAGRLPPDLSLTCLDAAGRREASGPPLPGTARLRVAFRRAPLAFGRMDVLLDGVRVGQLRPGMALVVPIPTGGHTLSARVWLRRLDLRDQINALPGTDSDFVIEGSGGRERRYAIDRHGLGAVLLDPRTVLVGPPGPRA